MSAGRLYCDLIFTDVPRLPSLGTEVFAGELVLRAGGGAFITAAYLRAHGRPAALLAVLPAAPFSRTVEAELARAGVEAAGCAAPPEGADPQVTVAMACGGDRAFLTRMSGPALPARAAEALRGPGLVHLHIGELSTLCANPWLIGAAREAGLSVSLDCAWEDAPRGEAADLIAQVDVFLPNAAEAAQLVGMGLPARPAPLTVVKQGAAGAAALTAEGVVHGAARPVEAVDPTGAGDAFNGGFLDAWLDGAPLEACLARGNAAGAAAVTRRGGVAGADLVRAGAR